MSKAVVLLGDLGSDHQGFPPTPVIAGSACCELDTIVMFAYIGYFSVFLGRIPLPIIVTIGFRYVALIEDRVATDSGGIATARMFWQGRVIGRFFRSSNVFAYLLLRSFRGSFFQQRASLLGDPDVRLPRLWQVWVMAPMIFLYLMVANVLIASAIIKMQ
ncbi:hypothetical protein GCM10011533_04390 [Streptosporangium jomthongense]|uniref:RDD domain-containing protein n=1 Tax=Marinobacter aromaticivorans TaxID=1494078 RepID=A0ABW2IQQ9_9GAMM|nr:hypothetical protein [Marinobacter aromaticivorans]GGE55011.1 hypothetical protein GCM10011533_04390 [Streptosporangium jomthongense]